MLKLSNAPVYLEVESPYSMEGKHRVRVSTDYTLHDETNVDYRVSPLFRIHEGQVPAGDDDLQGREYFYFFGPVNPWELIDLDCFDQIKAYGSFGLFNIVLRTDSEELAERLSVWIGKTTRFYEQWFIEDGVVSWFKSVAPDTTVKDCLFSNTASLMNAQFEPELGRSITELCLTINQIVRKIRLLPDDFAQELTISLSSLIEKFRSKAELKPSDQGYYRTVGWVYTVNSALSKFLSQTLSGADSILSNSSQFASHSLLGVGLAAIGLQSLLRYYYEVVYKVRIPEKFKKIGTLPIEFRSIENRSELSLAYLKHYLDKTNLLLSDEPLSPLFPLLPSFSGRDGFSTKDGTLSVPLCSVEAAGSYNWSLLTVTHELSHVITDAVLRDIYNWVKENSDKSKAIFLGSLDSKEYATIQDSIIERFFTSVLMIKGLEDLSSERVRVDEHEVTVNINFRDVIERHAADPLSLCLSLHHDIKEILTHVLDYQYFYFKTAESYIEQIWSSWSVIPTVDRRTRDYLIRTILSVAVNYLHEPKPHATAYAETLRILNSIQEKQGKNPSFCIVNAKRVLEKDRGEILRECYARLPLVEIIYLYFHSDSIRSGLLNEDYFASDDKYPLRSGYFEGHVISNPSRFLKEFLSGVHASSSASLWLFSVLAFSVRR